MPQWMRVRPGRAVWAGAVAILCSGVLGCMGSDKDKKPFTPPLSKGSAGVPGGTTQAGPPGGTRPGQPWPASPTGTTTGIQQTGGLGQPGYRHPNSTYDPNAAANPNAAGTIGVPSRPSSGGNLGPYPPPGSYNSVVPQVGPGGEAPGSNLGSQNNTGPASPLASSPGPAGPSFASGGPVTPVGGNTSNYPRVASEQAPTLTNLDPVPPAAPPLGPTPSVAPVSQPLAPLPPGPPPNLGGSYGQKQ